MPYGFEIKDLIIFAAGAVVALLVAYFFYKKGLERKQLSYALRVRSLVYRTRDYPAGLKDGLKITFDGKDVHRLTRVTLFVWNSGNRPITRADLETRVPLRVNLPKTGFTALQASVADQTREANNSAISDRRLVFDYLNPRDGFVVDIFGDKSDETIRLVGGAIQLEGEIVGATSDVRYSPYQLSATRAPAYIMIGLALLLGFVAAGVIIDPQAKLLLSPRTEYVASIVMASFFCLVSLTMLLFAFAAFRGDKLPAKLLTRDEESRMPVLVRAFRPYFFDL